MTKSTDIPNQMRTLVRARDGGCCIRCGGTYGLEVHHRRSRSVRDDHVHCLCNLVLLDSTCHGHAHANPAEASRDGLIVSRHVAGYIARPVKTWRGWQLHDCDGGRQPTWEPPGKDARLWTPPDWEEL